MKSLKQWQMLLSLVLVTSLFVTGCAADPSSTGETRLSSQQGQSSADGSSGQQTETIMQKMIVNANADNLYGPEMWIFQQLEKVTGVNFNVDIYASDQWNERKNLMFAANELPDVIVGGLSSGEIITYSQAGQIIPLNDLLSDYAPNYLKALEGFSDQKGKVYAPDGNMYGMVASFTGGYAETPGARSFLNVQWAKKVGFDGLPETYDEFYDMLVAFRDSDPRGDGTSVYPLSGVGDPKSGQSVDPFVALPLGITMRSAQKSYWQVVDGQVKHLVTMPIYEEYLKRMHQLYSEKLLDNEYYTQNTAQLRAKGANLQVGAFTDSAHFITTNSTDPAIYDQWEIIYPLTSEYQTERVWYGDTVSNPTIFLTSGNKNPEATLHWLDYLYTEEGAVLLCGPEKGEWDGDGGIVWNSDHSKWKIEAPEGYTGSWAWLVKEVSLVQIMQGNMQYSKMKSMEQKSAEDASFKDKMAERIAPYLKPYFPTLFYTPEEQEEISIISTDVENYFNQMEAKIVMGEEPLEAVETMRDYLNSIGLEKLTKVQQAAYDRYISNSK